jgi:chromosome segregation ATPase
MEMNVRSGRTVGRSLERAVEQIRQRLSAHADGVRELDAEMSELLSQRSETLLALARHYLPDLKLETIQGSFVEVRDELLGLLTEKQRRQQELHDQAAGAQRQAEHEDAELDRVTDELNVKVAERERLEELLAERLRGTAEFTTLSQRALETEQELNRNERRVADVQAEAKTKLPSYEGSRLFKYLYDAGYGTGKYQSQGFTRRIDGWIAKMIDFQSARRGYDFLRTTPELMKQEVTRRRDSFNELMQQVEAIEDRVSDEIGLTEVMRNGQQLGADRDHLVTVVAATQNLLAELQQQLAQLEGRQNEFYERAISRMKAFLERLPEARLERHSQNTPEREDDAMVAEVAQIGDRLEAAEGRGAELGKARAAWDQRLNGLQEVLQRFRQAEFDSQRSMFPLQLDADDLVEQYIAGRVDAQQVWSTLQSSQRFAPMWQEQRGPQMPNFPAGDISMVLLKVLTEVAGAAMEQSAGRGVERRGPVRQESRQATGRPPFPNRGFTNGRGF